jgi:hypothetical protein
MRIEGIFKNVACQFSIDTFTLHSSIRESINSKYIQSIEVLIKKVDNGPTTTAIITNNKQREQLRVDQKRRTFSQFNWKI